MTGTLLVAGTMIGSGVFLLPASLATIGTVALLGWGLAATAALLVGLTLGLLARTGAGGGFVDGIAAHLGPVPALLAACLYLLGVLLTVAAVALAVAGYVGFLVPSLAAAPATTIVALLVTGLFLLLNHLGPARVAQVGALTLVAGLVPIFLVGTAGWAHFDGATFRAGWNVSGGSDAGAVAQSTLLIFWAFLGLETASVVSRQFRNPATNVPLATIGGVLIATIVYVASTAAIAGMIPAPVLARSTAPFADATALILGGVAASLVAVAATAKTGGTLGAVVLTATESWIDVQQQLGVKGMGRGQVLLAMGAITALILWATASPSLGAQFGQIIGAVVALCFLVFAMAGVALARARGGMPRLIGLLAAGACLGLLLAQPAGTLGLAGLCLGVVGVAVLLVAVTRRARRI